MTSVGMVLLSVALAVALFEAVIDRRLRIRTSDSATEQIAAERPDSRPISYFSRSVERDIDLMDPVDGRFFPGGKVVETVDQFGMRASATRSFFPHRRTIALLGDSFTFGAEVAFEQTLQGYIAARFPGINVMNFGVNGSNSQFYAAQAKAFIEATGIRPDIYVVGLYKDMQIGDIPRREAVERYGGRVVYAGVQVSRSEYDRLKASWFRRATFEAVVFLREHSSTFNVLFPPAPSHEFAMPVIHDLSPERFAKWRADLLESLRTLSRVTALPPSRFIIWLVPSNHNLILKIAAQRRRKAVRPWVVRSDQFWAELMVDLKAAGFDVIEPMEAIERLYTGASESEYPFTATGHFRPAAYAALAELVLPCLAMRLNEAVEDARSQKPCM